MVNHELDTPTPKMDWHILIFLFLLAWAVRFIGLDWGYFHGDERVNQAAKVLAGQLVPDQHFYPPLMHYIAAVLYGGLYVVGNILDWWPNTGAFRAQYFEDPTIFYLTARALTGAIAALMTPLFYRIGRVLAFGKIESFVIAAFAGLAPISVLLSYIFKGDLGVATATVWIILLMIRKMQSPGLLRLDYLIGVGVCLALSFKHSAILLLVPFAITFVIVVGSKHDLKSGLSALTRIVGTTLLLWPFLNIGILLDLEGFIRFQQIQKVMSVSENGNIVDAVVKMVQAAASWHIGQGILMPIAFLLFPVLASRIEQRAMLLGIWAATVAALLLLAAIVGLRQPEQLWIAHFMVMQLFATISLLCIFRRSSSVGAVIIVAALAISLFGDISIWRQALAQPISHDLADRIEMNYPERKIAVNIALPLQKSPASMDFEAERVQRIADKYGVTMPEQAEERIEHANNRKSYDYVGLPMVMYGLENSTDEELYGKVEPFAWPPQAEDWQLQTWLDQGFSMFMIQDLDSWLFHDAAPVMKPLFVELSERCEEIEVVVARKPLFLERDVTILDCDGA